MEYIIAQFGEQEARGKLVKNSQGHLPESLQLQELFVIYNMINAICLYFDNISGIIRIKKREIWYNTQDE